MGRPKRKLSPIKKDNKIRKLTAFLGFSSENSDLHNENCNEIVPERQDEVPVNQDKPELSVEVQDQCNVIRSNKESNLSASKSKSRLTVHAPQRFNQKWTIGRDWLEYDAEKNLMFCRICLKAKVDNSFTSGCGSLKLENIEVHEKPKSQKVGK